MCYIELVDASQGLRVSGKGFFPILFDITKELLARAPKHDENGNLRLYKGDEISYDVYLSWKEVN